MASSKLEIVSLEPRRVIAPITSSVYCTISISGYLVPALRKAAQAAGRFIRMLEDRSAIILLGYRFSTKYCRRYLPLWIRKNMKTVPDEDGAVAKELILFFGFGKT